jgi:hypothetical protein
MCRLFAIIRFGKLAEEVLAPIEACSLAEAEDVALDTYPHLITDPNWDAVELTPILESAYRELPEVPV